MSEDELKQQVNRERTRIIRLRNSDEHEISQPYDLLPKRRLSWVPVLIVTILGLLAGRIMTAAKSIPQNALQTTEINKTAPPPTQSETAALAESILNAEEHVTDEQVKRMLSHVNGTNQNPPTVSPGVSGQMLNFGSGADTPEMVRVHGQWFRKNEDNIYNVKGETIYYENKKH
jgi:hypothetical protein